MKLLTATLFLSSLVVGLVQASPINPVFSRGNKPPPKPKAVVNNATIDLLKELEGFEPNFYDINGHKTIGYGHDCNENKDCHKFKEPMPEEVATDLFRKDLSQSEDCVCKLPNANELSANQYGALVSFAYNSGCGGVRQHWKQEMKKKAFDGICKALDVTNVLEGLLNTRRKKEADLCGRDTEHKSGC